MEPPRPPQNQAIDEENLAFEIAEDNKLRSIGIDPNGDPVEIMVELDRRYAEYQRQQALDD
jgi:hypothetical protein